MHARLSNSSGCVVGGCACRFASHAANSRRRARNAAGTTHTRFAASQAAPSFFAQSFCSNGTRRTPSHVVSTLHLCGRYMLWMHAKCNKHAVKSYFEEPKMRRAKKRKKLRNDKKKFALSPTGTPVSGILRLVVMSSATENGTIVCRGECLQQVCEDEDEDNPPEDVYQDAEDNPDFLHFVYEYISKDCPNEKSCIPQPCANFPLCNNAQPQWLLECKGGLCVQPCDMIYGRIFEFSRFTIEDACPVCLEVGAESVVYACKHMVCVKCYGKVAFNDAQTLVMQRCPLCRRESVPLGAMRSGRKSTGVGAPTVDYLKPT